MVRFLRRNSHLSRPHHDPSAASYADRVLFLADGSVVDEMRSPTADSVLEYMKHLGA